MRILYLDLDTLRPDHLGCYGYQRNTSPNIDRIAAQGKLFRNFYCSDAPCLPSRTALMTGMFGIHTGVVGHGGTTADLRIEGAERNFTDRLTNESLPALLTSQGMHTALISPFAERHSAWSFYAGFREMHNTGKGGVESAEEVTPVALDWIRANARRENWFLHLNYWDPHTPYRAPESFGNPFADAPLQDWPSEETIQKHRTYAGPHTAQDIGMYHNRVSGQFPRAPGEVKDRADFAGMIDGYDCGIRYMDDHIGTVLKALDAEGALRDTAIIVSADHGENLGELGIYAEHGTADYVTCRIPLIIKWPGVSPGTEDDGLHYNLDLLPTLADLFGLPVSARWDGRSFAPSLLKGEDTGRDFLALSQCAHVAQRGIRLNNWMYIRTYHDGFHPHYEKEMLFDIVKDPHEINNVADSFPQVCQKATHLLEEWRTEMFSTMPFEDKRDPLWTVLYELGPHHATIGDIQKSDYLKRLKRTGRSEGLKRLLARHPDLK